MTGYARKSSVWPATFGLACCAIELFSAGGPRHDLARFGMERAAATPRQADLMIVAGRVSQKMAPVLRQIYDQMSEPKWVISMGVCASSGGMFNNYAIVQGVDHIVPVDIYLPGCPPRPEMLLDAILKLHDKIQNMKLGVNRDKEITELEQARLRRLPLLPSLSGPAGSTGTGPATETNQPGDAEDGAPAADPAAIAGRERLSEQVVRTGMFGVQGTGDTSGYGGLKVRRPPPLASPRPYGVVLRRGRRRARQFARPGGLELRRRRRAGRRRPRRTDPSRPPGAPARGRPAAARRSGARVRDLPGVSGVHYPAETRRASCTPSTTCCRSRTTGGCGSRSSAPDADPHVPSLVDVYPACDLHERETWDFFGIVFDGHPALTRIEMPDDWRGHPQRKDYPLGGIPVEYRGATIPPPDERRATNERPSAEQARRDTAEGRVYNLAGQDWDEVVAAADGPSAGAATNASSSTWARSTRPPTA